MGTSEGGLSSPDSGRKPSFYFAQIRLQRTSATRKTLGAIPVISKFADLTGG